MAELKFDSKFPDSHLLYFAAWPRYLHLKFSYQFNRQNVTRYMEKPPQNTYEDSSMILLCQVLFISRTILSHSLRFSFTFITNHSICIIHCDFSGHFSLNSQWHSMHDLRLGSTLISGYQFPVTEEEAYIWVRSRQRGLEGVCPSQPF